MPKITENIMRCFEQSKRRFDFVSRLLPILPKKRLKCKNLLHFVEFLDIIYIIFYMRHFLFDICKLPRSV